MKLYTTPEISKIYNISLSRIHQLFDSGTLESAQILSRRRYCSLQNLIDFEQRYRPQPVTTKMLAERLLKSSTKKEDKELAKAVLTHYQDQ